MDDTLKIKALMIYFQHWGKAQIKAYKSVSGMKQTLSLLKTEFQTEEQTLKDGLNHFFYCMSDEEEPCFAWIELADILLQNMDGCFEPILLDGDYDEEEMLFDRRTLLEENLHITNEDTADMIYDLTYDEVLSADAILALF